MFLATTGYCQAPGRPQSWQKDRPAGGHYPPLADAQAGSWWGTTSLGPEAAADSGCGLQSDRNGQNLPHSGKKQHLGTTTLTSEVVPWLLPGDQWQDWAGGIAVPVAVSGSSAMSNMLRWSPPFALPEQSLFGFVLLCSTEHDLAGWDITSSGSFWDCSHHHEIPFIKWVNIRSYHLGPEETLALKIFMPENIWFGLQCTVLSDKNKCRAVAKQRATRSKNNSTTLFSFSSPLRSLLNIWKEFPHTFIPSM